MASYSFAGNANDVSGNGNNGTANGVTLRSDRALVPAQAYEFNGVSNNIVVPNSTSFDFAGDAQSISFWFQLCQIPGPTDDKEYYILSKMTAATNHGWHIFMRRDVAYGGDLRIYYRGLYGQNFATSNVMACNISNVEVGSWHHITFVLGTGGGSKMTSRLDNSPHDLNANKNSVIAQNNLSFVMGGGVHTWSANDRYFGMGRLDDVRIYNRAINDQEVTALYTMVPNNTFNQPITATNNNGLCLDNDSLIITATSLPGLTYSWTGPHSDTYTTNQIVLPNPTTANSGTYTLVPKYEGCPRPTVTVNITPPLAPIPLSGPTQVCLNTPFSYSVPNTAGAVYTWHVPGAGTPAANSFSNPSATTAESGNYWVTYSMGGCVKNSDTVAMNVVQQYSVSRRDTICQGQSVLLGGAQQTTAGSYQDMYQSVTGCDSLVTTDLFVKPLPQVSLGPDQQSCVGSTITLTPVTDGSLVVWSTGATTPTINVTATGNYWFEAVLNGCTARDTAAISFYLNPAADFTANDATQCLLGNSFSFTPDNVYAPGSTFAWTFNGAGTQTSTSANPTGIVWDADGSYNVSLVVTENNCVSAPANLGITVFPQPVADFTAVPQQGCEPVEVKFNNTTQSASLYSAAWTLGDGAASTSISPTHTYQHAGSYGIMLTVTDANGCTASETKPAFITVFPQPVAGFTLAEHELTTTEPLLQVIDASSQSTHCFYYLSDGTAWTDCSFTASVAGTGAFTITQVVTSGAGCIDSVSQSFTIRPLPEIFIPNTFTPDGDFLNERFEPSLSWIGDYEIIIYDRWGSIVFQTDDQFTYWNGKDRNYGKDLPQGIYAYRLRYKPYLQDKNYFVTGSVTLVR